MTTTQLSTRDNFLASFGKSRSYLSTLVPEGVSKDRIMRVLETEVVNNPKLLECDPGSLKVAVTLAARSGLEVGGGSMAQAFLIPRGSKAAFEPSYKGQIALAMRSGTVAGVTVSAVCQNDKLWEEDERTRHIADLLAPNRGPVVGYVAFVKLVTGFIKSEYMTIGQINDIRDRFGYSKKGSPWDTSYPEQAKKTVLKRALKQVPFSTEQAALLSDIDAQTPIQTHVTEVEAGHPGAELGVQGLEQRLALANQQESDDESNAPGTTPDEEPAPQEPAQGPSEEAAQQANPRVIKQIHAIFGEAGFKDDDVKRAIYQRAIKKLFSMEGGLTDLSQGQAEALARNLKREGFIQKIADDLEQEAHEAETGGK